MGNKLSIKPCIRCKGWGWLFIKPGIPNLVEKCPVCKGDKILLKRRKKNDG